MSSDLNRTLECKSALLISIYLVSGFTTSPAQANSVYVGYGQSEQQSFIGANTLNFNPAGQSVLVSLDITEDISVYAEYSDLDDSEDVSNRFSGNLQIESISLGASYYLGDFSLSTTYSDWQDELTVLAVPSQEQTIGQIADSTSYSASLSYDKTYESWQLGVSTGLHYSDWRQDDSRSMRDDGPQSAVNEGDSTFISLGVSAAHYRPLDNETGWIVGGSIRWNQLTNSESTAVSRNGRNISQIANRTVRNFLSGQNVVGSESYGQINLYTSYEITKHWVTDVNLSFDFGGEESSTAWSFNIGYQF